MTPCVVRLCRHLSYKNFSLYLGYTRDLIPPEVGESKIFQKYLHPPNPPLTPAFTVAYPVEVLTERVDLIVMRYIGKLT